MAEPESVLDQIYIDKAVKFVYKAGNEPERLTKAIKEGRTIDLKSSSLAGASYEAELARAVVKALNS